MVLKRVPEAAKQTPTAPRHSQVVTELALSLTPDSRVQGWTLCAVSPGRGPTR